MGSVPESPFNGTVLAGRVALVTGGTSGIGFEIAKQLGLHGAAVAVSGRRDEVLKSATNALEALGVRALGLQGDVRSAAACQSWIAAIREKWGRLDVLVNCAAGNFLATAEELSPKGFKTVMDIDAVGTFTASHAALPLMKVSDLPSIINISATLHYGATWYQVHAAAAKAAVDSITRSLALEWGEYNVRVNGVAPGPIEGTAGMAKLAPSQDTSGGARQAGIASEIPLGRLGQKWDIAMACVFLASPAARFISGDTLVVDGASWMYRRPLVPRDQVTAMSRGVEAGSRRVGVSSKM